MTHGRNVAYDELSLPVALEVDRLADQFRADSLAGRKPRIEDYIVRAADSAAQEQLLELLVEELELRRSMGEQPTVAEYKLRFDEYGDVVEQAFQQPSRRSDPHADTETFTDSSAHAMPNGGGAKRQPHSAPASIGRYRLEQYLGQGGFGQVWQAYDPELRRHVAIKFPRPDRGLAKQRVELLLHDARKAVEFASEGVVPVYDVGEADGVPFIVSAYMSGGSLADRLKNNDAKWDSEDAARLVARLAQALHRAHLKGLVHRDVKPGNILFDEQGQAYLTDFGLATSEQEQVKESPGTVGTWAYMSPEQVSGKSHRVDARADVYSLGVTLYRLLTGRLPFLADTAEEMRDQVLNREPRPLRTIEEGIARELESSCLRCLSKRVSERFSTAADLAEELCHFLDESSVTAVSPRMLASGLACLAAAVVAGVFFYPFDTSVPNHTGDRNPLPPPPVEVNSTEGLGAKNTQSPESSLPIELNNLLPNSPTDFPLDEWFVNDRNILNVTSPGRTLLTFGTTADEEVTFAVEVRQLEWTGRIGVFFGFRPGMDDGTQTQYQVLQIYRPALDTFELRSSFMTFRSVSPNSVHEEILVTQVPLDPFQFRSNELAIAIRRGQLVGVSLNDEELPELLSKHRRFTHSQGATCEGAFGVYCMNSSGLFLRPLLNEQAVLMSGRSN